MKLRWILILVFFLSLGIELIPQGTCQNTGIADFNAYPTISGIDFKNGMVTFSSLYLNIDANESFIVYIFTTALPTPTMEDSRTTYDNKTGIYSLSQQEFSNGFQLKFSLGEGWTLINDRLECGIAIGLNITANRGAKNVYPSLNFPLQDDWNVTATITEATPVEASQYALYGMYAINQSIALSSLTQFYVIKIDVIRNFKGKNIVYWIPPLLMLALLLVSLKLVREKNLENSLLVYVSVDIFGFGYLLTLMNITPPVFTSIEILTLVDVSLSFVFSIVAIFRHPAKRDEKEIEKRNINSETQNKHVRLMGEKTPIDDILALVLWIDGKKTELFQDYDGFRGKMARLVVGFVVLFLVVWLIMYEYAVSFVVKGEFGFNVEVIVISTLLSALAVMIAGLSLFTPYFEKNAVEVRLKRALELRKKEVESSGRKLRDFNDEESIFVKALIEIRGKNEGFTLEQLYDLDKNKAVFSKEKLLERLCK